ncbi:GNAT family N-acetyltransferase [Bacillus sp. FSL W7-1360]
MLVYKRDAKITAKQLGEVFARSGINRPVNDEERLQKMLDAASLCITAWDGNRVVGVARSLTDFAYCCYLSDLAVDVDYQKDGVGRQLLEQTRESIGAECSLILLSAPEAMGYYPKVGFEKAENAFVMKRER